MSVATSPQEQADTRNGAIHRWHTQTEIGVFPSDWHILNIGDLEPFITSGSRGWARYYSDIGSPFIRITNMSRQTIYLDTRNLKLVNIPSGMAESERTQLQDHDILISITADIGIVSYIDEKIPTPAYINQHIALLRFEPKRTDSRFISYFLASDGPQRLVRRLTDQGAKPGMSLLKIRKLKVVHPQYEEQQAIAAALSDVDRLIGALDKLIAKKRAIKLATMQHLLSKRLRLSGFSGAWKKTNLEEVIQSCNSGSTPSRSKPEFYRGEIRWITSGELNYGIISNTKEKITTEAMRNANLKMLPAGTFLMAITGLEAEGTRGSCGIVGTPSTTNQSCMAVIPTNTLLSQYLFYYYVYKGKMLALQYCQGTKQQSYTAEIVKKLPIYFPCDIDEQHAIVSVLSDMDAEITNLEHRRHKTEAIKRGMMQVLLTGRIRLVKPGAQE